MNNNKKIYIVLTYTGTTISKIIKACTKAEYCHVSISLDKELEEMYSFGRINPYTPIFAGFVHESPKYGTFKRFKNTETEIYSMEVSNKQYEEVRKIIKDFSSHNYKYRYNIIGLIAAGLNIKYTRKNAFYCAEFVKYVVDNCEVELELPDLIKPIDFRNKEVMNLEYKGILQRYNEIL